MSSVDVPIPPVPPRLTGNPAADVAMLHDFISQFRQQLIVGSAIVKRVDTIGKLAPLTITISDPPTKSEIDKIVLLLNNVINAANG